MELIFFFDFFLGLGMLERQETIVVLRHWFGRSLRPGKPLKSPRWRGGRHDGAEGAISTKQYTCLHIQLSMKLFVCLSVCLSGPSPCTCMQMAVIRIVPPSFFSVPVPCSVPV
jgi:hypothetical protein